MSSTQRAPTEISRNHTHICCIYSPNVLLLPGSTSASWQEAIFILHDRNSPCGSHIYRTLHAAERVHSSKYCPWPEVCSFPHALCVRMLGNADTLRWKGSHTDREQCSHIHSHAYHAITHCNTHFCTVLWGPCQCVCKGYIPLTYVLMMYCLWPEHVHCSTCFTLKLQRT